MTSIVREAVIEAPAARCWDAVRDFGALRAEHYNAVVQVIAVDDGSGRFGWAIDVLPDELGARVGALMDVGLAAIKTTLEG